MYVTALVHAPWVGVEPSQPLLWHKVPQDAITLDVWGTEDRIKAVCGARVQIVPIRYADARVRGTEFKYCQPCRHPETTP